jgi:membrane protease YdiL (CAAX protease family)
MSVVRRPTCPDSLVVYGLAWVIFFAALEPFIDVFFVRLAIKMLFQFSYIAVKGMGWLCASAGLLQLLCPGQLQWRVSGRRLIMQTLTTALFAIISGLVWLVLTITRGSITFSPLSLNEVVLVLLYVPISSCLQEVLTRGLLLHLLLRAGFGKPVANVLQAFVFAVSHSGDLYWRVDHGIFGYVMGWATLRYRNLYPAFVVHTVGNVAAVFMGQL